MFTDSGDFEKGFGDWKSRLIWTDFTGLPVEPELGDVIVGDSAKATPTETGIGSHSGSICATGGGDDTCGPANRCGGGGGDESYWRESYGGGGGVTVLFTTGMGVAWIGGGVGSFEVSSTGASIISDSTGVGSTEGSELFINSSLEITEKLSCLDGISSSSEWEIWVIYDSKCFN